MSEAPQRVRLDVWLWRARFFKTRALSAAAIAAGGVRLVRGAKARRVEKPGEAVGAGDALTFAAPGGAVRTVRIAAIGARRGPAPEARELYVDLAEPNGRALDGGERPGQFKPSAENED